MDSDAPAAPAPMVGSRAHLSALWSEHRVAVLAAAFGAAAVLGLRARAKGTTAAASGATTTPGATSTYAGSAGGATAYDSTANDVYNAIEPQIEALASQLNVLQAGPTSDSTTTTPVTTPPTPTSAVAVAAPVHVAPGTVWGGTGLHYGQAAPAPTPTSTTHYTGKW